MLLLTALRCYIVYKLGSSTNYLSTECYYLSVLQYNCPSTALSHLNWRVLDGNDARQDVNKPLRFNDDAVSQKGVGEVMQGAEVMQELHRLYCLQASQSSCKKCTACTIY